MFRLNGVRISVLDDSKTFLAEIKQILEAAGCIVTTYSRCLEAIADSSRNDLDIWIVDYEMPNMNGIQFIEEIRKEERFNQIPILMLTGRTKGETLVEAITSGADGFLEKSHLRENLLAHLLVLVRMKSMYADVLKASQLNAIKALIGTYKHEFGNALSIIGGRLYKLESKYTEISNDESLASIKSGLARIENTLKKLDQLREYEEDVYVGSTKILKAG